MILNQSQFAAAVGISRQAVSKLISSGVLDKSGSKIDTDTELNKMYINDSPKRKSSYYRYKKKFGPKEEAPTEKTPPKSAKGKKPKTKKASKQAQKEEVELVSQEDIEPQDDSETQTAGGVLTSAQVAFKTKVAQMKTSEERFIKEMLANQETRNNLANRKVLTMVVERFLNHFISGISRVSSTSLTDISKDVLEEGKVENYHFKKFEDACFELVDGAKEKMASDIKKANI